jgi:hypothetical protein
VDFWKDYSCSDDKYETVKRFEIGLNKYLEDKGFVGKTYMDLFTLSYTEKKHASFYMENSYELIRDIKMPVMKKKIIDFDNPGYVNVLKALEFVRTETNFDYSLIKKHMERKKCMGRNTTSFDFECMERFLQTHKRIFFYGNGVWAHNLEKYFGYRGWDFDGYLVTNKDENDVTGDVHCFSEMSIMENDGIIIAQHTKNACEDILREISSRISKDDILTPIYK